MKISEKFLIFLFLISFINSYYIPCEKNLNKTFTNFSYGSCFLGFLSDRDDIFKTINKNNPELWMWLGDAAYIDKIKLNYLSNEFDFDEKFAIEMFQKVKKDKCKKKKTLIFF